MPDAPEFSDRQLTALRAVRDGEDPVTAKTVAEAIEPGSDSRGAAQTLRRMVEHVVRDAETGAYKLTRKGINLLKKHDGA